MANEKTQIITGWKGRFYEDFEAGDDGKPKSMSISLPGPFDNPHTTEG